MYGRPPSVGRSVGRLERLAVCARSFGWSFGETGRLCSVVWLVVRRDWQSVLGRLVGRSERLGISNFMNTSEMSTSLHRAQ